MNDEKYEFKVVKTETIEYNGDGIRWYTDQERLLEGGATRAPILIKGGGQRMILELVKKEE